MRTLSRAVAAIGSKADAARMLGTTPPDLDDWLSGETAPPFAVFVKALELGGNKVDRQYSARRKAPR